MTTFFTPAGLVARYAVVVAFSDSSQRLSFREATFADVKSRVGLNKAMLLRMADKTETVGNLEISDCQPQGLYAGSIKRQSQRHGLVPVWNMAVALADGSVVSATISVEAL